MLSGVRDTKSDCDTVRLIRLCQPVTEFISIITVAVYADYASSSARRQKTFHSARIVEDYRAAAQNIGACDGDGRRAVPGAFSGAPRAVVAHGGLWAACCSYWQRPELHWQL